LSNLAGNTAADTVPLALPEIAQNLLGAVWTTGHNLCSSPITGSLAFFLSKGDEIIMNLLKRLVVEEEGGWARLG
jgi:hypothetical protein